jgi:hypothetical protein
MLWKPRNFVALMIATMACWTERQAAAQLDYLKVENRALRSRLGRGRIFFTDAERRTLGALAKKVSIRALRELDPIVSPTTLLRRHRVANASVEWLAPKNAWGVRLWGKNPFGAQYCRFETAGTLNDTCSPAPSRTYGMTLSANF